VVVHQAHRWGCQSLVSLLQLREWHHVVLVGNKWCAGPNPIAGDRGTPLAYLSYHAPDWIEFHQVESSVGDQVLHTVGDFTHHERVVMRPSPKPRSGVVPGTCCWGMWARCVRLSAATR
jgi:hypothetical protein